MTRKIALTSVLYVYYSTLLAQDKWFKHILKLDTVKQSDDKYAKLGVGTAWQISDIGSKSAFYYSDLVIFCLPIKLS